MLHVIWDLDGTLIDSEKEVYAALVKSVREVGLNECDQKAPFRIGPTIDKILDAAFDKSVLTEAKKAQVIAAFRANYDNCGFDNTPPFDGVEKILADARFVHHIVTNKPDLATGRILEKLGWKKYFVSVATPYSFMKEPAVSRKTKAELFALCMADFSGQKFVGVGDMDTDARAATANGIPAIGVLWGTGTEAELRAAACANVAKSAAELLAQLEALA